MKNKNVYMRQNNIGLFWSQYCQDYQGSLLGKYFCGFGIYTYRPCRPCVYPDKTQTDTGVQQEYYKLS